jgi:formylglycine-generating enzyme required for sulfatase activity
VPAKGNDGGVVEIDLGDGVSIKFVPIEAGTFLMGSPNNEKGHSPSETQHEVEISRPFMLGMYEVTQRQFRHLMGTNPSAFAKVANVATDDFPADSVMYSEALKFCEKLNGLPALQRLGLTADLPTEAEWEYACRAGTKTVFHYGGALSPLHANVRGMNPYGGAEHAPDLGRPTKVGSYKPNAWGLYDMHGNIEEWCKDWTGPYILDDKRDPQGPKAGQSRVLRGGSWQLDPVYGRSASRDSVGPEVRNNIVGFRVALRYAGRGRP